MGLFWGMSFNPVPCATSYQPIIMKKKNIHIMQFDPTNDYLSCANNDSALRDNTRTAVQQTSTYQTPCKVDKHVFTENVLTNS